MRELLAIGVGGYDDEQYNDLPGAINDASNILAFFKSELPVGYRFDRTQLLANPTSAEVAA